MVTFYRCYDITKNHDILLGKRIYVYGRGHAALSLLPELKSDTRLVISGVVDSTSETGEKFAGLPVFSISDIPDENDVAIYIATGVREYTLEILEELKAFQKAFVISRNPAYGPGKYDIARLSAEESKDKDIIQYVGSQLADEESIRVFDNLIRYRVTNEIQLLKDSFETSHRQYFPGADILSSSQNEVFLDAGGYNGETSIEFADWVQRKYRRIYILEADSFMNEITKENIRLSGLKNVEVVRKGAWSASGILHFKNDISTGSSHIDENGGVAIETISIDELLDGSEASYIKMDIEGAEYEALLGASKTIEKFRPKLAISIYHKEDDLWKLPYYLMKNYPFYRFYIRHYTDITTETVLYATV